jgi:hypothetical protein
LENFEDKNANIKVTDTKAINKNTNNNISIDSIPERVDTKIYQQYAQLKVVSTGETLNKTVYATIIFDVFSDNYSKSITAIKSVTSNFTPAGVATGNYSQDKYSAKSISPTYSYTLTVKGMFSNSSGGMSFSNRVTFDIDITANSGSYY